MKMAISKKKMRIDDKLILPDTNEVISHGVVHRLKPKEMAVLILLIGHQGHTLTREFILNQVWGEFYGNDLGLSQAISSLRKVFDDNPRKAKYIRTIPKKGYQFLTSDSLMDQSLNKVPGQKPDLIKQSLMSALLTLLILSFILMISFLIFSPRINIRVEKEAQNINLIHNEKAPSLINQQKDFSHSHKLMF